MSREYSLDHLMMVRDEWRLSDVHRERALGFDVTLEDSPTHRSHPADWKLRRVDPRHETFAYVGTATGWYKAPPCESDGPSTDGDVYVIHAPEVGRCKIGCSTNVEERLAALQTGSPVRLELVRTLSGGFVREHELHARFADFRVHGEWFSDDVIELLPEE